MGQLPFCYNHLLAKYSVVVTLRKGVFCGTKSKMSCVVKLLASVVFKISPAKRFTLITNSPSCTAEFFVNLIRIDFTEV